MTPAQLETVRRLARCTMLPGSWDKRFVRGLSSWPEDRDLSPRQAEVLDKLRHRYRRQLGPAPPPGPVV